LSFVEFSSALHVLSMIAVHISAYLWPLLAQLLQVLTRSR